jgi:hypothetical protein
MECRERYRLKEERALCVAKPNVNSPKPVSALE